MRLGVSWYVQPVRMTWHAFNRFRQRAKLGYGYKYREGWLKEIAESFLRAEVVEWQDDKTALLDDLNLGVRYVCHQKGWQWWIITCLPLRTSC